VLNQYELRAAALRSQARALKRIPQEEHRAMLSAIESREAAAKQELGYLLRVALNERVPLGMIREAVGAKNWKTWRRLKFEYGLVGLDETEEEEGE
jgi:hypothetical protein